MSHTNVVVMLAIKYDGHIISICEIDDPDRIGYTYIIKGEYHDMIRNTSDDWSGATTSYIESCIDELNECLVGNVHYISVDNLHPDTNEWVHIEGESFSVYGDIDTLTHAVSQLLGRAVTVDDVKSVIVS